MFDDGWLSDLLQHRSAMLSDAAVAQRLATALAEHRPDVDARGIPTRTPASPFGLRNFV